MFLQPQHLQQQDRYHENALRLRTASMTPHPWGVAALAFQSSAQDQGKVAFRQIVGALEDGTVFDMPDASPLPAAVTVPEDAQGQYVWLTLPERAPGAREVSSVGEEGASRYVLDYEAVIDSASDGHAQHQLDLAHPRFELVVRSTPRPGHLCMRLARVLEVRDQKVPLDRKRPRLPSSH